METKDRGGGETTPIVPGLFRNLKLLSLHIVHIFTFRKVEKKIQCLVDVIFLHVKTSGTKKKVREYVE